MTFAFRQKVLFKHCDPAGIVFFPRFYEMINDCVEDFFDKVVHLPFENMHPANGMPTAQMETRFAAPCYHGDHLVFHLTLTRVGNTSLGYTMQARCEGDLRLEAKATVVQVDGDGRPMPWSDDVRRRLTNFKDNAT